MRREVNLIPNGKYYIQYGIEYNTREAIITHLKIIKLASLKFRTKEELLKDRCSAYTYLIP